MGKNVTYDPKLNKDHGDSESSSNEESHTSNKSKRLGAKGKKTDKKTSKITRNSIRKARSPVDKGAQTDKGGGTSHFKPSTFKPG